MPLSPGPSNVSPLQVEEEGKGPVNSGRRFLGEGKTLEGTQAIKEVPERTTHPKSGL